MKGFAAALTGAVGGLGQGISEVANKYMDDQILRNRQQALLDMQRASNLQQAKDLDEFQNDPTRREKLRVEAGKDSASANSVALEGKIAEATNTRLTDARRANLRAEAAIPGEVAAEQVKTNAADPAYLKSVRAVALADPRVQAQIDQARASIAQAGAHTKLLGIQGQAAQLELNDRKKLDSLFDRYDQVLNDKTLDDKARGIELGKLTEQLNVMRAKTGKAGAGAQESDTVKVTEEEMLPGGGTRKTERTERRKPTPGAGGDQPVPFQDGTELRDKKSGKLYIVRNGVPVLKDGLEAGQPSGGASRDPTNEAPAKSTLPEVGALDQQIYTDLQPLAAAFQDAREKFRAAARSGDANAIEYWKKPMVEAEQRLRQKAESRLGNGAQRYYSTLDM